MHLRNPILLITLVLLPLPSRAAELTLSPNDQIIVAFTDFLRTGNITNMATGLAPSLTDWEAEARRFNRQLTAEQRTELQKSVDNDIRNITRGAENLLQHGKRFGIFTPAAHWTFKNASSPAVGRTIDSRIHQTKDETMRTTRYIRLSFLREDSAPANRNLNGEYSIDLNFASEFPGSWRIFNGLQWSAFPSNSVPPMLQADMTLAATLPPAGGDLTLTNDPALQSLARTITTFLSNKDTNYFATELIYSVDLLLKVMQERNPDEKLPPKNEMENAFAEYRKDILASVRDLLQQAADLHLNLADATVKNIVARDIYPNRSAGLPQMFRAKEILVTFTLPESTTPSGTKIAAIDCVLASAPAERIEGRWYLQKMRWAELPKSLLTEKQLASQALENYVAKYRRLPPNTPAPEIQLLSLENPSLKKSLADFRGKLVFLEFWATWCGPCQQPMAELQKARAENPAWADRVELITLSIDDDAPTARKHLASHGWTNTHNFWAGGDWSSPPAKAFRVTAIPTVYLISPEGKIIGYDLDTLENMLNSKADAEPKKRTHE